MIQIIKYPWDFLPRFTTSWRLKTLLRQFSRRTKDPKPFASDPNVYIKTLFEYLQDNINASLYINEYRSIDAILLVLYAQQGEQKFKEWHAKNNCNTQENLLKSRSLLLDYLDIKGIVSLHEYDSLECFDSITEYPWFKNNDPITP